MHRMSVVLALLVSLLCAASLCVVVFGLIDAETVVMKPSPRYPIGG